MVTMLEIPRGCARLEIFGPSACVLGLARYRDPPVMGMDRTHSRPSRERIEGGSSRAVNASA